MFTNNHGDKKAKQIFVYLNLKTDNATKLDTVIANLSGLKINFIKDSLGAEYFPLPGGILLKFVSLILESIEFIANSFFYLIETL